MQRIYTTLATLVMALLCALPIDAFASTIAVSVSINGKHPSQLQWDGVRVYWLPFDVSTISSPDLVVCLVQDETDCSGVVCPDSDKCTFSFKSADRERPFAIAIYDWDGILNESVSSASAGLSVGSTAIASLRGVVSDPSWAGAVDETAEAVSRAISSASASIDSFNARRFEFIDAGIFLPMPGEAPEELSNRVRAHAQSVTRLDDALMGLSRLQGPITAFTLTDCTWPSPACAMAYVDIEFKEENEHEAE